MNEIIEAIQRLIETEGCGCCEDFEGHSKATADLAYLLGVKPNVLDPNWHDYTPLDLL